MFVIILNSSNVVNDGKNSSLIYNFPNSVQFKDKYLAVSQVIMYYSWFNLTSQYSNNRFSYTWTVGTTTTTYNIIIPDGLYNIVDINAYCQFTMINNGTYLINSSGDNVYYFQLVINPNRYGIELTTFQVPTSLPVGFSQPSNFAGYPTTGFNPVINFPNAFCNIVGYGPINSVYFSSNANVNNAYTPPTASVSNYYVAKNAIGTLSYLSNIPPNVQPNSSVFISISNINNPYSQPSSIIYALTPSVDIGEQIISTPPNFMWTKLIDGTYNQLRIQLLGIDKAPIILNDPNMTIVLTIRDKEDNMF